MTSSTLTIKASSNTRQLLLFSAVSFALIATLTANFLGTAGNFGTIFAIALFASIISFVFFVKAVSERFTIDTDTIRHRHFMLFGRSANRALIDEIAINKESGKIDFVVKGHSFATFNFSAINISQDDLIDFAKIRNIPVEITY
jgi:uncharacterized membrane protein